MDARDIIEREINRKDNIRSEAGIVHCCDIRQRRSEK